MANVWWCKKCQVPLVAQKCEACGYESSKPFARDVTPVFAEEMSMLRDKFGFIQLPNKPTDFYLWSSGARYYINGGKVATLRYRGSAIPFLDVSLPADYVMPDLNEYNSDEFIVKLGKSNKNSINAYEYEAIQFIQNTTAEFSGYSIMVAMSGGKDSTVVSDLVRRALGKSEVIHVMSDTTIESATTYEYLDIFHRQNPKVPLVVLTPTLDYYELCYKIGPPSRLRRWCCTTHKANQMSTIVSALRHTSSGVLTFDGVRSSESAKRATYTRITHKHKITGEILASPIKEWNNIHIWVYLIANKILFNYGYRLGYRRVGCLPCPFNSLWSQYLTKLLYPEQHQKWNDFLFEHAVRTRHPNPAHFVEEGWRTRAGGRGMDDYIAVLNKDVCLMQERTFIYKFTTRWTYSFFEFIKPFGAINITEDDKLNIRGVIIRKGRLVATFKVDCVRNSISITYESIDEKKWSVTAAMFERQIKKFQSCIQCGSCNMKCNSSAISVNGVLAINEQKCTKCLACVLSPCIAVSSLSVTGIVDKEGVCNG